jgi:hypothetical protein
MDWLIIVGIVLLVCWAGGYWAGPSQIRGNNAMHVVLVIVVVLLFLDYCGGTRYLPHHHWGR